MNDLLKHKAARTKPISNPLSTKDERLLRYSISFVLVFYVGIAMYIVRLFQDHEASRQAVDFLLKVGNFSSLLSPY